MSLRRPLLGALAGLSLTLAVSPGAWAASPIVRSGSARFEVLTPTLIRLQYAADRRFTDAPTLTVTRSRLPLPRFTTRVAGGWLTIRTAKVSLAYRTGSGPFSTANLRLRLSPAARAPVLHPSAGSASGNLGGWTRALDDQAGPVPLHPGVLSTTGWYVLDDTQTVLLTKAGPGFAPRPAHTGAYEDWYLFAYGRDYATGLRDLRALTGPAPLLPRSAFGVWFSRYFPYSESDYHSLLGQFRANRVPLDTLSIDTDFKRENNSAGAQAGALVAGAPGLPYSWNGWEWDSALFPDPQRFIDWAHGQRLSLAINIHPTIDSDDPRYPAALAQAGSATPDNGTCRLLQADPLGTCETFDWNDARGLSAYFGLHAPFAAQGIDMFWLDWCCDGPQTSVPGLTEDTWINSRYAAEQQARGQRWPAFSRIGAAYAADGVDGDRNEGDGGDGALADHRYTIQFTGDTCATWAMLGFEAQLSASEGNIGLPYVSDDIGSYNGVPGSQPCGTSDYAVVPGAAASHHLPDDLYARWVQFGTFQPLDRLHSNHGDRLPWEYDAAADASATRFLQLREALVPYTYTAARTAYDAGQPITGGLYLSWPGQPAAYQHPAEYTFGPDLVVEPVTVSGDPAPATVWIPPGSWSDEFTGQRFTGPRTVTLSVPLSQMPVLVRAGSVIPTAPYAPNTAPGPAAQLTVTAYPGTTGRFSLYDDAGTGFAYAHGAYVRTPIVQRRTRRTETLVVGPMSGRLSGAPRRRSWQVVFAGVSRPHAVRVNGRRARWTYASATRTLTVLSGAQPTRGRVLVSAS